jgi:hypothetical protein
MPEEETKPGQYFFYVAGVKHHKLGSIAETVKSGDPITLVPEPENEYDANAIRCEFAGTMVGYVPARLAKQATIKDNFDPAVATCTVKSFIEDNQPWNQLLCELNLNNVTA